VLTGGLAHLALNRAAADRAGELRADPEALAALWGSPSARAVWVGGGRTLVHPVTGADRPRLAWQPASALAASTGERFFLGRGADGSSYWAVHEPPPPVAGLEEAGLREVGTLLDDLDAGLLVHAVALANWHETHGRCPRCGAATRVSHGGHVRVCRQDGSEHYPRTDPAVIVVVVGPDGRALLGRQAAWPPAWFSTLAGFVEPGESAEAAVVREIGEEAGIRVRAVEYLGSQPWPFPSSLMLGYLAHTDDTEIRVDGVEIAEARWFTPASLRAEVAAGTVRLPPPVSIARRLIERWNGAPLPGAWRA
jgi:NAD+ diphosphatase